MDMGSNQTALRALRAATTEAHRRLDSCLNLVQRFEARLTRQDVLAGYKCLLTIVEAETGPFLRGMAQLDFAKRCRAARIDAPTLSAPSLPIASTAAALGALYVTEGATLGGRMILRAVSASGHGDEALAFLDPYGEETGAMWLAFCAVANQQLNDTVDGLAEAICAAQATFRLAGTCLAPGSTGCA